MPPSSTIDFSRRVAPHELPELMDGECGYDDFRDCLLCLARINRWLLGYRPTLQWLGQVPRLQRPVHILDVGSGGGDLLRTVESWAKRRAMGVQLTGVDMNPLATRTAEELTSSDSAIRWITGDAMEYQPEGPVDIIVSSLMAHHLEDDDVVRLLEWTESTARVGWFINDLERSQWSHQLFGWLPLHPIVRHDGPVSFRRAFRSEDWRSFLERANIPRDSATIEKRRPGRLCVGRWK